MYHTFFFFQRLSLRLDVVLRDARLLECFSQQKDEIVFRFYTKEGADFYVRADLSQGACLLTFPSEFHRTRSNSADLFPELEGNLVTAVRQSPNDRSFHLVFSNRLQLCFKMYGNRSNLLLHNGEVVLNVFNHHLRKDLEGAIPDGKPEAEGGFSPDPEELRKKNFTFSKRIWKYWETESKGKSNPELGLLFNDLLQKLETGPMYLCREENEVFLSFLPLGQVLEESGDPVAVSNQLSRYFWQVNRLFKQKAELVSALEQSVHQARMQLDAAEKQWLEAEESRSYRNQADLLMAFGHTIEKGATEVVLPDFEGAGTVTIKLKRDLSVVENAERLYRKAKGQQQDIERLQNRALQWKETLDKRSKELESLRSVQTWAELKPFLALETTAPSETANLPYHLHRFMDYEIWVGKNAKANDEILRLAHKDDLWLHARDVTGSHVIVRNKKGKTTPQPVLERAAEMAAFYSKAKSESLSPVMVTERKYVRKGKNMLPGQVRVEKEKTLIVSPRV